MKIINLLLFVILLPFVLVANEEVESLSSSTLENKEQVGRQSQAFQFNTIKKSHVITKLSQGTIAPIVLESDLIVLDAKGSLYSIDNENLNNLKWKLDLSKEYINRAGLSYKNGYIFCTIENAIYKIEAKKGEIVWEKELGAPIKGDIVVLNDKLIALTIDNYLYALNINDSAIMWTYQGSQVELTKLNSISPVVADDIVIVPFSSGDIIALDEYGTKLWSRKLSISSLDSPFTDISTTPSIEGEKVIVTNESDVFAFELRSGEELWSKILSVKSISKATEDHVCLITNDNKVIVLDLLNGDSTDLTENIKINKNIYFNEPVFIENKLFITTNQGMLIQLDPVSRVVEKATNIPSGVYHPLVFSDSSLYFTTNSNGLFKIG